MKIRHSFVSNSSTSSFIILGFKAHIDLMGRIFEEEVQGYLDKYYEDGYDEDKFEEAVMEVGHDNDVFHCEDHGFILGKLLGETTDYGTLEDNMYSLEDLDKMSREVASQYCVIKEMVKLYIGTRQC